MSDLKYLRKQIDDQDEIIMKALEKRLEIARAIGKFKQENKIEITNSNRELEILKRCENYQFSTHIKAIYQSIFSESKKVQTQKYALVGQNINYSLSPTFHKEIVGLDYDIIDTDDFQSVIKSRNFLGINVTIPFKTQAFEAVDELSPEAIKTSGVNTIINRNDKLIGYNTDYLAFKQLLKTFDVNITNKKVIIIGNGATARTVKAALKDHNPKAIINLVRTIRNENEALISQYKDFLDYEVIINTTPYGSASNFQLEPLFDLDDFYQLETVIDVIYQPLNSPLLQSAKSKDECRTINGLYMLIAQAFYADELFLDAKLDPSIIDRVYQKYFQVLPNIVLIGMPYSGKTTIGKLIAKLTDREFIDTDYLLAERGQDLNKILNSGGAIDRFRKYESELIKELSLNQNKVIATGGGSILNPKNVELLKANGVLIWLSPSFENLTNRTDGSRPLAKNTEELEKLYLERLSYYLTAKDIIVHNNGDIEDDAKKILEKYYEYLNN